MRTESLPPSGVNVIGLSTPAVSDISARTPSAESSLKALAPVSLQLLIRTPPVMAIRSAHEPWYGTNSLGAPSGSDSMPTIGSPVVSSKLTRRRRPVSVASARATRSIAVTRLVFCSMRTESSDPYRAPISIVDIITSSSSTRRTSISV